MHGQYEQADKSKYADIKYTVGFEGYAGMDYQTSEQEYDGLEIYHQDQDH